VLIKLLLDVSLSKFCYNLCECDV